MSNINEFSLQSITRCVCSQRMMTKEEQRLVYSVAYEAGGRQTPGLKDSGQTLFSGQVEVAQKS